MNLREFLSDRLGRMAGQLACAAGAVCFLWATGTRTGVLTLLVLAGLVLFLLVQTADYLRLRAHLAELEKILADLDEKYLFAECIPKPKSAYERKLFALNRRAGKSMLETVSQARSAQRAYREYVESWVHEIKTPITAARMLCQGLEGERRRKFLQELAQIEAHVQRALYYARAESPERDCLIRQTALSELVAQAIQAHQTLLIQSGVRVEMEDLPYTVYTDEKWAGFLLGQLLQNAARYRGEDPVIRITARPLDQKVELRVEDNGLGIPAHEISRVFDRGFTGSNGRARGASTGMGLYLCQKVAGFLGLDLCLEAEEGKGTSVSVSFPGKEEVTKS